METSRPARRRVLPSRRFFARFVHGAARLYLKLSGIRLEIEGEH